jgi:hypothetical protein
MKCLEAPDQMPSLEAPPNQSSTYSMPLPQIEYTQIDAVLRTHQPLEAPWGLARQPMTPWSSLAASQYLIRLIVALMPATQNPSDHPAQPQATIVHCQ